jgi:hypothetical protein
MKSEKTRSTKPLPWLPVPAFPDTMIPFKVRGAPSYAQCLPQEKK